MSNTWIDKGYHEEWTFECSACGGYSPEEYDFCPHCGAAMQLTASNEKKCKTYAEDFFEKFPNAEPKYYDGRGKEQRIPIPCRQHCYGVVGQKCNGIGCSCSACWNAEMEDADE